MNLTITESILDNISRRTWSQLAIRLRTSMKYENGMVAIALPKSVIEVREPVVALENSCEIVLRSKLNEFNA